MLDETSDLALNATETNVYRRRHQDDTSTPILSSQPEISTTNRSRTSELSFYSTSDKVDILSNNENKKKHRTKSKISSLICKGLCCKLFFIIGLIYLIMYLRPDYALFVRNSVENILKRLNLTTGQFQLRPGEQLAQYRQPSMPIIIIPGIVSTGLELWRGTECATGRFRHRFWTSMQMVDNIGRDYQCWLKHLSLNLSTWYV